MPMFGSPRSDYSFGDTDGSKSRPRSRLTAGKNDCGIIVKTWLTYFGIPSSAGSRPTSRSGSRGPSSRNGSRPASRANSESNLSTESIEGISQRKLGTPSRPRFSATATGLRRTPSEGSGLLGKERWKWQEASTSASSSMRHESVPLESSAMTSMTTTTMTVRLEERQEQEHSSLWQEECIDFVQEERQWWSWGWHLFQWKRTNQTSLSWTNTGKQRMEIPLKRKQAKQCNPN